MLQILETKGGYLNLKYVYICPPCGERYGPFARGETIPGECHNGCPKPLPRLLAIPRSEASLDGKGLWDVITDEPEPRKVAVCSSKTDAEQFARASNIYHSALLALRKIAREGDDTAASLAYKVLERVDSES